MKQESLPGVDTDRDLESIARKIERACIKVTRGIVTSDRSSITFKEWTDLVRAELKGFKITRRRLDQNWNEHRWQIMSWFRGTWGYAREEYRQDLDDKVIQAYALVRVSDAKAAGLTIEPPPTNLKNRRAYFADEDVGKEADDGRSKRTGKADEDGTAGD